MKPIIAAVCMIVLVGIGFLVVGLPEKKVEKKDYIIDNRMEIDIEDVVGSKRQEKKAQTPPVEAGKDENESDELTIRVTRHVRQEKATPSTLRYFKHIQRMFKKSKDVKTHLADVEAYLASAFSPEEARQLFEVYKKYLECEIDLAAKMPEWGSPSKTDELLAYLRKVQDFRRERLGNEIADGLFGAEVKSREYAIRRAGVVNDSTMSGKEKETLLKDLTGDMWGEDAQAVETYRKPYHRYREKLRMYENDLSGTTPEEREALTRKIREEFFPPEMVEEMADQDEKIARDKEKTEIYRNNEAEILAAPDLSDEEKQNRIRILQDETFGDRAEAFRRRENIRKDLEKRKAEYKERMEKEE